MAQYVPSEIEAVLEQAREALLRWHREDTLGEIAILRGGQTLKVQERPVTTHEAVRRESPRAGYVEKVGQA